MRSVGISFVVFQIVLLLAAVVVMAGLVGCANPDRGLTGAPGQNGITGPTGDTGAAGPQGPVGSPGRDGADASGVTVVKLCPGQTVYPTTFVEVAFCIGGKLYGTYSTNGGFSTEVVPGAYSSNAVGSRCNFVVQPNCVVVN